MTGHLTRILAASILAATLAGSMAAPSQAMTLPVTSVQEVGGAAPTEPIYWRRYGWRGYGWGWRSAHYGWGWRRPYYRWAGTDRTGLLRLLPALPACGVLARLLPTLLSPGLLAARVLLSPVLLSPGVLAACFLPAPLSPGVLVVRLTERQRSPDSGSGVG